MPLRSSSSAWRPQQHPLHQPPPHPKPYSPPTQAAPAPAAAAAQFPAFALRRTNTTTVLVASRQPGSPANAATNRQPSASVVPTAHCPFSLLLPDAFLLADNPKATVSLAAAVSKLLQRWELQLAERELGSTADGRACGGHQDGVGSARESKDSRPSTCAPAPQDSFCNRSSYGGCGSSGSSSSGVCAEAAAAVAAAAVATSLGREH